MRVWLISDNHDTLVGLRLAGIEGVLVNETEDILEAIDTAVSMSDVGILVVTERISAKVPDVIQRLRENGELPLVIEIPDRHGTNRGPDFLTRYVRDAIGVKMG